MRGAELAQTCVLTHQERSLACVAVAHQKQWLITGSGPLL